MIERPILDPDEDFLMPSSSASDCTGLVPAGGSLDEEWESYQDLFPFGADREPLTE